MKNDNMADLVKWCESEIKRISGIIKPMQERKITTTYTKEGKTINDTAERIAEYKRQVTGLQAIVDRWS